MKTNNFGYVIIATGEYSDYANRLFKVLKPFTFSEQTSKLSKSVRNSPDTLIAALSSEGFIEDSDKAIEVNIGVDGKYSDIEISEELGKILFEPSPDYKTQLNTLITDLQNIAFSAETKSELQNKLKKLLVDLTSKNQD